jgi:hypothetical protein
MCEKFNLVYDVYVYINWFDIFCYDMHAYWIMLFLKVLDLYNRIIRDGWMDEFDLDIHAIQIFWSVSLDEIDLHNNSDSNGN